LNYGSEFKAGKIHQSTAGVNAKMGLNSGAVNSFISAAASDESLSPERLDDSLSVMDPQVLFIIGAVVLFVVMAYMGHLQAKKRREAFQRLADELGFRFAPAKDARLAQRFGFLEHMDDGHRRYAFNVLYGRDQADQAVHIFDYHYETYSRDSKGRRTTHHHYFSIFTLELPTR